MWQSLDFSFRRKYEYLLSKQVQFDGIEEVHRIRLWVVKDFLNSNQPFVQFCIIVSRGYVFLCSPVFVFPMSSEALLGNVVHALTAYLYLYPLAIVCHKSYVQSLITIGFRVANPIAYPVGMRLIYLRQTDVDVETIVHLHFWRSRFEDDAHRKYIIHFIESDMLGLHFVPDGIDRFDTCHNTIFQPHLIELLTYRSCKLSKHLVTFSCRFFQLQLYLTILFRMLVFET